MAKVYVKFNTAVIKEIPLNKDEITFGRKSDNHIVIDHPTISGHHGRLRKENDHFIVEDLNSTNGTFINGRRIKSGSLKDRDQIGVAGHILDFYDDDSVHLDITEPPPPISAAQDTPRKKTEVSAKAATEPKPLTPEVESLESVVSELEAAQLAPKAPAAAKIRIMSGAVDGQTEIQIKEPVTYIGTKSTAAIKIKGFLAPELAAVITRRANDYFLKAIKAGYPKVNGTSVQEQILLENGAVIEMAGSYMVFVKSH